MLEKLFLQILNMSFTGGIVIVFVLFFRLLLKKAPKVFSYGLWAVALFRLVCPFSFESAFSLLPTKPSPISQDIVSMQTPRIDTGILVLNNAVNSVFPAATPEASVNPLQIWVYIGSLLWVLGMVLLFIYSIATLAKLKKRLQTATICEKNIFVSNRIDTAFVVGVFHPRIYLPAALSDSERRSYVLLHEQTHIRRLDHVVKLLSFLVLCVHWFNPLVWLAFFLCGKDMELSCDEAVIKRLGNDVKKDYSTSLLTLATGRRMVGGTPLAFGEGDTKGRIKNVLSYKKPAFWVVVVAMAAVIVLAIGLMSNPGERLIGKPSGSAGLNAIILKIDTEGQTMIVEGIDPNSAIGDQCMVVFSNANLQTVNADGNLKTISIDAFNEGDYVVLFVEEIQETYPTTARATAIQLQNEILLSGTYSAENLYNAATPYIGDNSAVGKLIGMLPVPMGLQYDHFTLKTSTQPYQIEIVYSVSTEMLDRQDTKDSMVVNPFRKNALLLLALVDNADEIRAVLTDGNREVGFINGREWAESTVGGDVRDYAQSPEKLQKLIDFTITGAEEETASAEYSISRIDKNGQVVSGYSSANASLAQAIVMDALVKSAAWPGTDVSSLTEGYLIRCSYPETEERSDFYAYRLSDGTAVLQTGANGMYSILSEDLYVQLEAEFA